jgi:hypothetical protein
MVDNTTLDGFNQIVARIAELGAAAVEEKLTDKKLKLKERRWSHAYTDIRWSRNGESQIEKLRVILVDNTVFSRVRLPARVSELFEDAYISPSRLCAICSA